MNYNDGKEHTEFYEGSETDLEQVAEQFAEGDSLLKDCLLKLWNQNIKTSACCKGHNDKDIPYLSIIINKDSQDLLQTICNYINMNGDNMELSFDSASTKDYDTLSVYMANEQVKNQFLSFLSGYDLKKNQPEKDNNSNKNNDNTAVTYANYLLPFARRLGINCRYRVLKDEMQVGFYKPNTVLLFGNNDISLGTMLPIIYQTSDLPLIPMSCDSQSMEEFINYIYPNALAEKRQPMQR